MTFPEFDASMDALFADCRKMKSGKGKEYANSDDRLANFKEIGASLGISAQAVCMIYLEKHMRSIKSYVKTGEVLSEPVRGRIVDAITYLALLNGIIEEDEFKRVEQYRAAHGVFS